jgi:hypothetical protein
MKKMEKIDDKLFKPLTLREQRRVTAGLIGGTQTANTIFETVNPPDFIRDGDNE